MKFEEYREQVQRTCPSLGSPREDTIHMVLGIQTEAAELSDIVKKNLAYQKPIDWANFKEELGDLMWYIANLMNIHGLDSEDIFTRNIEKLKVRYPNGFTTDQAISRDLPAERATLEK
jgi:NTP pyrophosphatase (non-canonical NTP hydrolase)